MDGHDASVSCAQYLLDCVLSRDPANDGQDVDDTLHAC